MPEINFLELEFGVDMGMNRFPDSAAAGSLSMCV